MASDAYLRFLFCLSAGLFGLCTTLGTLLDTLFSDWDLVAALEAWVRHPAHLRHTRVIDWSVGSTSSTPRGLAVFYPSSQEPAEPGG
jgi:hypothetical protein